MRVKKSLSAMLAAVMLLMPIHSIAFADGETPEQTVEAPFLAGNMSYRFDASEGTTVLQDCTNVTAGTEGRIEPQIQLAQTNASVTFKSIKDLSYYDEIELNFAAQKTATITFEGSADGVTYTKIGEIVTETATGFGARTARTNILGATQGMTYLKITWNAASTDQWYNSITLINNEAFDAAMFDYSKAVAGTTPITDIWNGWTADGGNFIYQTWGNNKVMDAHDAVGMLYAPKGGYAAGKIGYRIEFKLGKAAGYHDVGIIDTDGMYSYGFGYDNKGVGFQPGLGETAVKMANCDIANRIKVDTSSVPAENIRTEGTDINQPVHTFGNDVDTIRIDVLNHCDVLTEGETQYNNYYTVQYTFIAQSGEETSLGTYYYDGYVNGFGGFDMQVCGYENLKITPYESDYAPDLTAYKAITRNKYYAAFDDAMSHVHDKIDGNIAPDNAGTMRAKVTLLADATMWTAAQITENNFTNDPYIDGRGHKLTINEAIDKWPYYENVTIDTAGDTPFAVTSFGRFNNIKINGLTKPVNNLILNEGYIKNSKIDNFTGLAVVENSGAGRWTPNEYKGIIVIENTEITNSKINHYNNIDTAVRIKTDGVNGNPSVN